MYLLILGNLYSDLKILQALLHKYVLQMQQNQNTVRLIWSIISV